MDVPLSTYTYLLPEIIVLLTGMVVLVADLVWPARDRSYGVVRSWPTYVSIAGLLLAAWAVVAQIGVTRTLFNGIMVVDPFASYFQLLFIGIGVLVLLMSVESIARVSPWTAEFAALVLWTILGSMLLASAAELFTIFLSLQLTSLPLIIMVGYAKRDPRSGEAALKYLLLVLVSTAVLLYGMSLVYGWLGTSTLSEIGGLLGTASRIEPVLALGLVLLLTGFAFKITAAPFHYWVPDTYEGAPTPVTAFMSVGSKLAGFALALRVIVVAEHVPLDWQLIFGLMAAISMTLGNLGAIRQKNIKRMLAYSGIAQAGYLLVGVAAAGPQGISSVLFFALAYTFANLAAFAVVIIVSNATGSELIEDYAGLAKRAPLVALTMAVALLSLGGLPLMAGFMAKFYVFLSAMHSGLVWLVAIAVANSVISLYYYLRVVYVMYVLEGPEERLGVEPRAAVAMSLAVFGVLALGVFPEPAMRAAVWAASSLFGR